MSKTRTILQIEVDDEERYGITVRPKNKDDLAFLYETFFTEIYKALDRDPGAWLGEVIIKVSPDAMGTYAFKHSMGEAIKRFNEITGDDTKVQNIPLIINRNAPKS